MDYSGYENRRQHPRVREDLKVVITGLEAPGDEPLSSLPIECHTKDISLQGMCIVSDARLQPGSKLQLQAQAGSPSASFSFSGIVIWCNYNSTLPGYETGIQLLELDNIPVEWKNLILGLLAEGTTGRYKDLI